MNNVLIKQLINVLSNDVRAYRDLKKLLQDKFEAIKARDAAKVEETTAAQDDILRTIAISGNKRMQLVDSIAKILLVDRKDNSPVSIVEIASKVDEPEKGKLIALRSLLHKEVDKVQSLTRINNLAVKKMLNHLDFVFKAIVNLESDTGVYKKTGKQDNVSGSGLVDAIA